MYALLFGMVGTLLSNLAGSITFVLGQELGINQKNTGSYRTALSWYIFHYRSRYSL